MGHDVWTQDIFGDRASQIQGLLRTLKRPSSALSLFRLVHGHFHAVIDCFESKRLLVLVCRGRYPNDLSLIQVHRPLLGFSDGVHPFDIREDTVLILSCTQDIVRDGLCVLQKVFLQGGTTLLRDDNADFVGLLQLHSIAGGCLLLELILQLLVLPDHLLRQVLVECGTRSHLLQLILRHKPLLSEASSTSGLEHIPLLIHRVLHSVSDGGLRLLYMDSG